MISALRRCLGLRWLVGIGFDRACGRVDRGGIFIPQIDRIIIIRRSVLWGSGQISSGAIALE
jgi:hypothetical protein